MNTVAITGQWEGDYERKRNGGGVDISLLTWITLTSQR